MGSRWGAHKAAALPASSAPPRARSPKRERAHGRSQAPIPTPAAPRSVQVRLKQAALLRLVQVPYPLALVFWISPSAALWL